MHRSPTLPVHRLVVALCTLCVVLASGGCEDSVDPTVGLDVPFSLYGQLDPTADRQAIRVAPIALSIDADSLTIDAAVTSTDLAAGVTTVWRDSLVTFANGSTGHVFVADFTPRPGSSVRIDARRSDGAVSSVTVEIPPLLEPTVGAEIFVDNGIGYPVRIAGAPGVLSGSFAVTVAGHPDDPPGVSRRLTIPLRAELRQAAPGEWTVDIPFVAATRAYLQSFGLVGTGLGLVSAEYSFFVTGPGWTPPSTDPDVLVEPGTFSNVTGGLGFVGAGYRSSVRWIASANAAQAAGFTTGEDPAGLLILNEIKLGADAWIELYNPTVSAVALQGYSLTDTAEDIRRQPLINQSVPARGFAVIPLAFSLSDRNGPVTVGLYGLGRELILSITPDLTPLDGPGSDYSNSYGSYPDGFSYLVRRTVGLRERRYDLFKGPLTPTPNAPNDPGLALAFLNEINTEGAQGWVETVTVAPGADSLRVLYEQDQAGAGWLSASRVVPAGGPFGVAEEDPLGLVLQQSGGGVILLGYLRDTRIRAEKPNPGASLDPQIQFRALDFVRYGGQTPGRTTGRLPDARGEWTSGLRPTRGAPNASTRLGL